jgi:hypothetical protein
VGIGIFGDFSFGIIFQQVSLRLVTHCAGGFGVGLGAFNEPQLRVYFFFTLSASEAHVF